jgi:4-hydroxy-2-oxoheptanedioate aldolase
MRPNFTLQKLRAGQPATGIWFGSHNPLVARILARQGLLDWMMIDCEHTPVDTSAVALCAGFIADSSQGRCAPMARVTAGTVDQIKRVLDSGAQGVLVPLVNTPAMAAEVVQHAKYPPQGARGNGGMLAHLSYDTDRADYTAHANEEIMVGIQIETREAVDNIDAILDVPGIDCAFIGPNDLHIAYGFAPSFWSEGNDFHAAALHVLAACQRKGVIPGILCANATQAKARIAEGFRFVGFGNDVSLLMSAVEAGHKQIYT